MHGKGNRCPFKQTFTSRSVSRKQLHLQKFYHNLFIVGKQIVVGSIQPLYTVELKKLTFYAVPCCSS